jgi:hypothetical protein
MFSKKFKVTLFLTGHESRFVSGYSLRVRPLVGEYIVYYDTLYRVASISHKIPGDEFILLLEKFDPTT